VIKYKVFKTSEEFEVWQMGCSPNIIQIFPLSLSASIKGEEQSFDMETQVGCFVTYSDVG